MRKLKGLAVLMSTLSTFLPSIRSLSTLKLVPFASGVTKVNLFERDVFLKRDDVHFHPESGLNGNKGRKFMTLLKEKDTPINLISYGGVQSNSLAALCKVATFKKKKLWYITNSMPAAIKHEPVGSYKIALDSGATIIEAGRDTYNIISRWSEGGLSCEKYPDVLSSLVDPMVLADSKFIDQGGSMSEAKEGVDQLGSELANFIEQSSLIGPWKILVASGTGTTALFLANYFAERPVASSSSKSIEVVTVPCVGSAEYLKQQMLTLSNRTHNISGNTLPTILSTEKAPNRVFAKPNREHLKIWQELQRQSDIDFDLIYAPRTIEVLLSHCSTAATAHDMSLKELYPEANIIYYHCGGLEGNISQLDRYKTMGLL